MINFTKVYNINDRLVVAKNVENAIRIYKEYYPYQDVTRLELMMGNSLFLDALIEEDANGFDQN